MRDMFSKCLVEQVITNPNTFLLSGDHGYALFDALRKEKPDHFINAGVAEQNMIGVGAGLSKQGLYPIMYGLSAFVPIRVLEQIKIDFCYENIPGLFIGDGAGVVYSHLGASHQSTEDIAVLRALPNISILSPCDKFELKACFDWAVLQKNPVYMRLGKADLGEVYSKEISNFKCFEPQQVSNINTKSSIAIAATGSMVNVAMKLIDREYIQADVFSFPFIKPLEAEAIHEKFKSFDKVFVLEEHSIFGGLASALAEILAAKKGSPTVHAIGVQDVFSKLCGTYDFLMAEHNLSKDKIKLRIHKLL